MKWIGQHIYDLIARYRSDVYLENISTGTIASGGNLGLDSDNKIVKATVSGGGDFTLTGDSGSDQTISTGNTLDIAGGNAISTVVGATDTVTINHDDTSSQASVNNSGRTFIQDITLDTYGHVTGITSATDADTYSGTMTSFAVVTDSGNPARYTSTTAANISILGDNGVGVTNSSGTITAVAVPGEIDHDSLQNFEAAEHVDWASASAGTIHATNYTNTTYTVGDGGLTQNNFTNTLKDKLDNIEAEADITDATNVTAAGALMDSELTDLAGVKGMTVANKANVASPTFTGTPAAPTAGAGTNTTQIATTAHVKASIDARYSNSTISFNGQATMLSSGNWVMPGKPGVEHHTWNFDSGVNTEVNDTTAAVMDRRWQHMGIRVPFACVIAGLYCSLANTSGNRQVSLGLFCGRDDDSTLPNWGTTTTSNPKLQIHADAISEGVNYTNKPSRAEVTGASVVMAAGDIFYPAIKLTGVTSGGNTDNVYASFTVHIKTLIS